MVMYKAAKYTACEKTSKKVIDLDSKLADAVKACIRIIAVVIVNIRKNRGLSIIIDTIIEGDSF